MDGGLYIYVDAVFSSPWQNEFAGRHNIREQDAAYQMSVLAELMSGKRLTYRALIEKT